MGGLIRRMPGTAVCFLIGAVAISGLPPLNGFVSEWLTYQALLAGFGTTQSLTRLMFPIAGALLALTAALAAACFVKAFGITFLALPRSEAAPTRRKPPLRCASAWRCWPRHAWRLGLGATWFFRFRPHHLTGRRRAHQPVRCSPTAFALQAGNPRSGTVSPVGNRAGVCRAGRHRGLLAGLGPRHAARRHRSPPGIAGCPD